MRKFRSIPILTLSLSLLTFHPNSAFADCETKACVNVYVKDGQIVIDGKKSGSSATSKVTSTPRATSKATKKPVPKPRATIKTKSPTPKATFSKRPYAKRSAKPRATKSVTTSKQSSPSLADQILQSLPTLQVAYQPEGAALTGVPVIFFTDLPKQFSQSYKVVGVNVTINVKPKSLWEFGDGSTLLTNKSGEPYPSTEITHTYFAPGTYPVVVATIWDGTFTVEGVTKPISGVIRQVSTVDVKVVGAATRFVGK